MKTNDHQPARGPRLQLIGGASVAVGVSLFVLQPLLRYVDPGALPAAGAAVLISLVLVGMKKPDGQGIAWIAVQRLTAALPAVIVLIVAAQAMGASRWNDLRCERIQSAMLKPGPATRTDLPSLFQALGCRPQGTMPTSADEPDMAGPPSPAKDALEKAYIAQHLDNELSVERSNENSPTLRYFVPTP